MAGVELIHRDTGYSALSTYEDSANSTVWCNMHSGNVAHASAYRPCFSTALLRDLRNFQLRTAETFRRRVVPAGDSGINHVVLASAADVFNFGGDLDLFCRLIRAQDRKSLMDYAQQCVDVAYGFYADFNESAHTIALVQGDALGGGFEAALCCNTIVAETGVGMGFPEVLFDLFPGMGAYSFLCKRVSPAQAERMMLDGNVYPTEELYKLGVVDFLVPRGEGFDAVQKLIRRNQRIGHARTAMNRVQNACHPVSADELTMVTNIWVDTALQLGDKSLRTMERLVRAQLRRPGSNAKTEASNHGALSISNAR